MTREEAQKEFEQIDVDEMSAWMECVTVDNRYNLMFLKLEKERIAIKEQAERESKVARDNWLPLFKRKRHLQAFLEMST